VKRIRSGKSKIVRDSGSSRSKEKKRGKSFNANSRSRGLSEGGGGGRLVGERREISSLKRKAGSQLGLEVPRGEVLNVDNWNMKAQLVKRDVLRFNWGPCEKRRKTAQGMRGLRQTVIKTRQKKGETRGAHGGGGTGWVGKKRGARSTGLSSGRNSHTFVRGEN